MGRPRAPHGTKGGYRGHKDRHERVCDACQRWKDGEVTDTAPQKPKSRAQKPIERDIDFVQETLRNLQYVETAMVTASADKVGPLSKRKSELLRELKDYQDESGANSESRDPLDNLLNGGGPDMSNVTPIGVAS